MPPEIRRAVAKTNVDLCSHNISAAYHRVLATTKPLGRGNQAVELYLEAFEQAEVDEIAMSSETHRDLYGAGIPHVTANATIMTGRKSRDR